jgi:hypothetical protein
MRLLPKTPFAINPGPRSAKRALYPEPYVKALKAIADQDYVGVRLDYVNWQRFHDEVRLAYSETVVPLLTDGVTEQEIPRHRGE